MTDTTGAGALPTANGVVAWAALSLSARYRAILSRSGSDIALCLNGSFEKTGTVTGEITGIKEWAAGNQFGASTSASQQFKGYIHRISAVSGGLAPVDI